MLQSDKFIYKYINIYCFNLRLIADSLQSISVKLFQKWNQYLMQQLTFLYLLCVAAVTLYIIM